MNILSNMRIHEYSSVFRSIRKSSMHIHAYSSILLNIYEYSNSMYNESSIYFLSINLTKLKRYSYEVQTNDNTLSISEIVNKIP